MIADDELVDTVAKTVHVRELGANADDVDRDRDQSGRRASSRTASSA